MNKPESNSKLPDAIADLQNVFGDRLQTSEALRRQHANTLTFIAPELPDAVVWPLDIADITAAVGIARRHQLPIIPYGAGTSLEGHVNAPFGGISIDLSRMDRIIEIRADDLDCTVEAGVTRVRLDAELRDTGLFFPVDPGAGHATLGGMAATRASGTTTVKYGSMAANTINLTAVMPDASVITTSGRAWKSAAGYDLTRLLIGSEGTLGIIAELTLRLHGRPHATRSALAAFPSLADAAAAAADGITAGLAVARIELLDTTQIEALNAFAGTTLNAAPSLLVEFHGSEAVCEDSVAEFETIASEHACASLTIARTPDEQSMLWKARSDAFWAVKSLWPGHEIVVTDAAVPLSALAKCVNETEADLKSLSLHYAVVGHVGDGNFHVLAAIDPSNLNECNRLHLCLDRLAERAISLGGTSSGEHGIGQGKRKFMRQEHGPAIDVMRSIKNALDPDNLFNPGKLFPDDRT